MNTYGRIRDECEETHLPSDLSMESEADVDAILSALFAREPFCADNLRRDDVQPELIGALLDRRPRLSIDKDVGIVYRNNEAATRSIAARIGADIPDAQRVVREMVDSEMYGLVTHVLARPSAYAKMRDMGDAAPVRYRAAMVLLGGAPSAADAAALERLGTVAYQILYRRGLDALAHLRRADRPPRAYHATLLFAPGAEPSPDAGAIARFLGEPPGLADIIASEQWNVLRLLIRIRQDAADDADARASIGTVMAHVHPDAKRRAYERGETWDAERAWLRRLPPATARGAFVVAESGEPDDMLRLGTRSSDIRGLRTNYRPIASAACDPSVRLLCVQDERGNVVASTFLRLVATDQRARAVAIEPPVGDRSFWPAMVAYAYKKMISVPSLGQTELVLLERLRGPATSAECPLGISFMLANLESAARSPHPPAAIQQAYRTLRIVNFDCASLDRAWDVAIDGAHCARGAAAIWYEPRRAQRMTMETMLRCPPTYRAPSLAALHAISIPRQRPADIDILDERDCMKTEE
jgi:hypothetical protein